MKIPILIEAMTRFVLDTGVVSLLQRGNQTVTRHVGRRLSKPCSHESISRRGHRPFVPAGTIDRHLDVRFVNPWPAGYGADAGSHPAVLQLLGTNLRSEDLGGQGNEFQGKQRKETGRSRRRPPQQHASRIRCFPSRIRCPLCSTVIRGDSFEIAIAILSGDPWGETSSKLASVNRWLAPGASVLLRTNLRYDDLAGRPARFVLMRRCMRNRQKWQDGWEWQTPQTPIWPVRGRHICGKMRWLGCPMRRFCDDTDPASPWHRPDEH